MTMQIWDPFSEFRRFDNFFNRLLGAADGLQSAGAWYFPMDVTDDAEHVTVKANLPGANPDHVQVTVENGTLSIKSEMPAEETEPKYLMRERPTGSFYRSITLPDSVDTDKATTHYEHGVLVIEFPKLASKRARQIKINAAAAPKKMIEAKPAR